ncbi:MAG: hypothetical protein HYS23_03490 [Geobacter sp.]|nr:hypothetical protein [Geobacter sp.]
MPLYVNAKDSRFANNTGSSVFRNFTGVSTHKYVGNAGGDRDTYSVLASFGADIKNGSEGAGVGIAQYFATGLAARELAKKGGAELVTLQAQGRVSDEIKQAAAKQLANWNYKIDLIAAYVDEDGIVKKERLEKLIKNTGLGNTFVEEFKGKPIDDFKKSLHSPLFLGNVDGLAASISK